MSIATTVPQRSQGMSLLSITSLVSGGRRGRSTDPASSRVLPITASIWRVNSSPKGLKIAARCVVIGSDGSPTTSQEIWQRPSPNSCSKMRPISPSRRCRNTYAQALERRCFSNDTSGGNRKLVLLFTLEAQSKDHKLCADATVEQPRKKNSPDYITYRSQSSCTGRARRNR